MTKTRAIALAIALGLSPLSLLPVAISHPATAYADPYDWQVPRVETIDLTEVHDIDSLPVCEEEDCSDQVGQTGVWLDTDTGDWYLERGEDYTRRIIDTTVRLGTGPLADWGDDAGYDAGYEN